jgi:hypothetical protein
MPRYQVSYPNRLPPLQDVRASADEPQTLMRFVSGWLQGLLAGLVLLLVLARLWSGALPDDCRSSPIAFQPYAEFHATMNVAGSRACVLAVRIGFAGVSELAIAAPPRHGTIESRGRTGVVYRPASAFSGEDAFALAMTGRDRSGSGAMVVRVKVVIR